MSYVIDAEIPLARDARGCVTEWQPMRGTFTTVDEYHEGLSWVTSNGGRIVNVH